MRRIGIYGVLAWCVMGCPITPPDALIETPEPPVVATTPATKATEKTDSTGEPGQPIHQRFDGTGSIPASLCGTGSFFSFLSITPDPIVPLASGTPFTIRAQVQFSLPPGMEDAIGLVIWSTDTDAWDPMYQTPVSQYTPISGSALGNCESVDLILEVPAVSASSFTVSLIAAELGYRAEAVVFYYFDGTPFIRISAVSPGMTHLLAPNGLTGTVSVTMEWDMKDHEVYSNFFYMVYDATNGLGESQGYLDNLDLVSLPVSSGTFTYQYDMMSRSCQLELLLIFQVYDFTTGLSSDLAAAHWYFHPPSFTLLTWGGMYAQPGAGPQTESLIVQNCTDEEQLIQLTSDSSWLTLSETSLLLPGDFYAFTEYAVDATGLVPYSEHRGILTATSNTTGDSASGIIELAVGSYYEPCVPSIEISYVSGDSIVARPGAQPRTYFLVIENCTMTHQVVDISSSAPWLSLSQSSVMVYANSDEWVEYSVDATGLTPSSSEQGVITATSRETLDSAEATVALTVGDYYIPPTPYTATPTSFVWNTAADSGNGSLALGAGNDDRAFAISFPFPITLYGTEYANASICGNGGIMFGVSVTGCPYSISWPSDDIGMALALNWGDLYVGTDGSIRYATTGVTPNRKFVVSFNNVGLCCNDAGSVSTFQAVFSEGSDTFTVQYGALGYQYYGGTNFSDGPYANSWDVESNTAYLVSP